MLNIVRSKLAFFLQVFIYLLSLSNLSFAATIVNISPTPLTVGVGEQFTFNVEVTDVSDLSAFDITLHFDPNILSFVNITEGDFLQNSAPLGTFFFTQEELGLVRMVDAILGSFPGANQNGILATLEFLAINTGTSPLLFGSELRNSTDTIIDTEFEDGSVTVDEPISIFYIVIGILLLSRKKKLVFFNKI